MLSACAIFVTSFGTTLRADPTALVTCTPSVSSVPVFSTSSVSGEVGDYTLDCTGGNPAPSPPFPEINVYATMNVPILGASGWILSVGGTPISGTLASLNQVEFLGVPVNPPGPGTIDLTVEDIFVNPSLEPPGFQFTETVSITGDEATEIPNQLQLVAQNAVPEPFTLPFVGVGLATVLLARRVSLRLAQSRLDRRS